MRALHRHVHYARVAFSFGVECRRRRSSNFSRFRFARGNDDATTGTSESCVIGSNRGEMVSNRMLIEIRAIAINRANLFLNLISIADLRIGRLRAARARALVTRRYVQYDNYRLRSRVFSASRRRVAPNSLRHFVGQNARRIRRRKRARIAHCRECRAKLQSVIAYSAN